MYLGLNSAVWSYGPPIEIVGCITSHAQIATTTYFSGAVNSEVAYLIMVCWAFLLQSFGAELIGDTRWPTKVLQSFTAQQIGDTRWPTEVFAHA